jgi:hypothetical protein
MSRRTLLGAGLTVGTAAVVIGVARAGGVLDDALRTLGAEPRPKPDPGDTFRLSRAATAQSLLIASIDATVAEHRGLERDLESLRVVADEQLVAVGGRATTDDVPTPPADPAAAAATLSRLAADSAEAREDDAVSAASPDVARVLASMSAGLSQLARKLGEAS